MNRALGQCLVTYLPPPPWVVLSVGLVLGERQIAGSFGDMLVSLTSIEKNQMG